MDPKQLGDKESIPERSTEMAYIGLAEDGTWGLRMGEWARVAIIDMGLSFSPLYRIMGPLNVSILFLMFIWGLVRRLVTIIMRAIAIYKTKGAGLWMLGAFWSLPFQITITPFRWAGDIASDFTDPRIETEM